MIRQAYDPTRAADQIVWLENFRNKLAGHAPTLGITVARCEAAVADARWLIYTLGSWLPAVRAWQKSCTDAATAAQTGSAHRCPGAAGPYPAAPACGRHRPAGG